MLFWCTAGVTVGRVFTIASLFYALSVSEFISVFMAFSKMSKHLIRDFCYLCVDGWMGFWKGQYHK
jgi:hypothetical protein